MPRARFWKALPGGRVQCGLCPHACTMAPGQHGRCRTRRNDGGELALPLYGRLSALAVDPIEKKPLYHFLPGSEVLSAGFFGCNLRCPFCQNWSISQETGPAADRIDPGRIIEAARSGGEPSIAFTYSEPSIHFEYILETARLAREAGLRTVLVTNGFLSEAPARELLAFIDAANIDLKCWDESGYRDVLGGGLAPVLDFIRLAKAACHVEVTTLVVPGLSDTPAAIAAIAAFLAGLDADLPFHLSAYHPAWKYHEAPTGGSLLEELALKARESLHYVYVGNVPGLSSDSHCPSCGELLVRRRGYAVTIHGLGAGGLCANCGTVLPFVLS